MFELRPGAGMRSPVPSAPHSGRCYPGRLLEGLALPAAELRPLDDGPVDLVLAPATRAAGLLVALLPRAWIDLNRAPAELDPAEIDGADCRGRPRSRRACRPGSA
ncbi:MAG: N-formylglutamate amidohydrolase [Geminicoccaceae bacterium]